MLIIQGLIVTVSNLLSAVGGVPHVDEEEADGCGAESDPLGWLGRWPNLSKFVVKTSLQYVLVVKG